MAGAPYQFEVRWHPFQLRPQMPMEGVAKAPNTPDNPRAGARLKAAGEPVGIDFTGATDRYPNTLRAHVLVDLAGQTSAAVQDAVSEALFHAYFTGGRDVNDLEVLVSIGEAAGMTASALRAGLNDKQLSQRVSKAAQGWSSRGIGGVPYFIIDDHLALSGAQDPSAFTQAFAQAARKAAEAKR